MDDSVAPVDFRYSCEVLQDQTFYYFSNTDDVLSGLVQESEDEPWVVNLFRDTFFDTPEKSLEGNGILFWRREHLLREDQGQLPSFTTFHFEYRVADSYLPAHHLPTYSGNTFGRRQVKSASFNQPDGVLQLLDEVGLKVNTLEDIPPSRTAYVHRAAPSRGDVYLDTFLVQRSPHATEQEEQKYTIFSVGTMSSPPDTMCSLLLEPCDSWVEQWNHAREANGVILREPFLGVVWETLREYIIEWQRCQPQGETLHQELLLDIVNHWNFFFEEEEEEEGNQDRGVKGYKTHPGQDGIDSDDGQDDGNAEGVHLTADAFHRMPDQGECVPERLQ